MRSLTGIITEVGNIAERPKLSGEGRGAELQPVVEQKLDDAPHLPRPSTHRLAYLIKTSPAFAILEKWIAFGPHDQATKLKAIEAAEAYFANFVATDPANPYLIAQLLETHGMIVDGVAENDTVIRGTAPDGKPVEVPLRPRKVVKPLAAGMARNSLPIAAE